jgi:GrpB-like predicted nucleotidyltransferase (UPF0157 family)
LFREEQRAIRHRLGRTAVAIEHVGSSSVAGLVGRAEIDILVGVRANAHMPDCAAALQFIGYGLLSQSQSPIEGWAYLGRTDVVRFEVLVARHFGPLWRRHVLLRDYLRSHPARAAAYGALKVRWASQYGADSAMYKEAKRRFWSIVAAP